MSTRAETRSEVAHYLAEAAYEKLSDAEVHYSEETGEISFGCDGRQVVIKIAVANV